MGLPARSDGTKPTLFFITTKTVAGHDREQASDAFNPTGTKCTMSGSKCVIRLKRYRPWYHSLHRNRIDVTALHVQICTQQIRRKPPKYQMCKIMVLYISWEQRLLIYESYVYPWNERIAILFGTCFLWV